MGAAMLPADSRIFERRKRAVLKVGDGRGFVVRKKAREGRVPSVPVVVTAAHCLPFFPPCHSPSYQGERTYRSLLGRIGEATAIWAECLFADPVADIAVLGPPDTQVLPDHADAYEELMATTLTLPRSDAPTGASAWLLSLDLRWFPCHVGHDGGLLWITEAAERIRRGMSGSPIIDENGNAIGVLCTNRKVSDCESFQTEDGGNARLALNLPPWLAPRMRGVRFDLNRVRDKISVETTPE